MNNLENLELPHDGSFAKDPADSARTAPQSWLRRVLPLVLAAIPLAALTIATPLVNRVEPRIFGLPFLLAWIAFWVLAMPVFVWSIGRIERRW